MFCTTRKVMRRQAGLMIALNPFPIERVFEIDASIQELEADRKNKPGL